MPLFAPQYSELMPDDSVGIGFMFHLEKNINMYNKVLDLLEDNDSKMTFLKVLKYRLFCFNPECLSVEDLPYSMGNPYSYKDLIFLYNENHRLCLWFRLSTK